LSQDIQIKKTKENTDEIESNRTWPS
jgi:hypothetical protein